MHYSNIIIKAAKKSGKYLSKEFRKKTELIDDNKSDSRSSIYSMHDVVSNKIIIKSIKKSLTNFAIYSEESGFQLFKKNIAFSSTECEFYRYSGIKFVIDPICGSIPFARGVADFIISIAVLDNNILTSSVVYDPIHKELFHAERGNGAFLNEKPIFPSNIELINESYISIEHKVFRTSFTESMRSLVISMRRLRVAGTCALEMCYVACGRLDAVIKLDQPIYDYLAALLIVEETNKCKLLPLKSSFLKENGDYPKSLSFILHNGNLERPLKGTISI